MTEKAVDPALQAQAQTGSGRYLLGVTRRVISGCWDENGARPRRGSWRSLPNFSK